MEWSLVLLSQGLEPVIQHTLDEGWYLELAHPAELATAVHALEQYHRENRHARWRRRLHATGLLFDWRSVFPLIVFIAIYVHGEWSLVDLRPAGWMSAKLVRAGEWWRLFTAVSLHGDAGHLAANATTGFLLLGLAMGGYGPGGGMLLAYLAGAGGNLLALGVRSEQFLSLGASGMVMGALGLLSVQTFSAQSFGSQAARQWIARGVFASFLLLVLLGMNPASDVLAHVGGFVSGTGLGLAAQAIPPRRLHSTPVQLSATLVVLFLFLLTWFLALR